MEFTAQPGVRGIIKFRVGPGVNVVDPGVVEKFVVGSIASVRDEHDSACGGLTDGSLSIICTG